MMKLSATHEVFVLPYKNGYLVYAPLAGRILYANGDCVTQLRQYLETRDPEVVNPAIRDRLGGLEWLNAKPLPVALPVDRQFHPASTTLFLTNRCNLRCRYCYAEAGEREAREMPPEIYRAAIDFAARNARRGGYPLQVGFHGGGEPTMAWDALTGAVEYGRKAASDLGLPVVFGLATNGVMSRNHAEFVAATFPTVTLSFDGPADLQDAQRPGKTGSGSFDAVMAFVETIRAHKINLIIRATVTARNVHRLVEMVDFFADQTPCCALHFEPMFFSGRARRDAEELPNFDVFADAFLAAVDRARERGLRLRYSAARLMGTFLSFCGCAQDAFNVTPDGVVTACFEVCDGSNPLAAIRFT